MMKKLPSLVQVWDFFPPSTYPLLRNYLMTKDFLRAITVGSVLENGNELEDD